MTEAGPTPEAVNEQVETELLRIHEESYGAGARHIKSYYADDIVFVVIDVELTQAEEVLLEAGQDEAVRGTREGFQKAIESTFVATVERATGKKVLSFLSHMSIDPLYSIEVFRLDPGNGASRP